jgi:hypothetical protein
MKILKPYFSIIALFSILLFASCEKVINVNLPEGEKKVVIDGSLTDQAGGCIVKLSQTKAFNDDNSFVGLTGAQVTIKQGSQLLSSLTETSPGIYTDVTLKGTYGKDYTLTVTVNGQTYTAVSTMPYLVPFDSLYTEVKSFFGDDHTFAVVKFNDPVDTQNNYRCIQYINNKRTPTDYIFDDEYSDGKVFESTLYFDQNDVDSIKTGDAVRVELQGIDKNVYQYWYSFDQSASGGGGQSSAAPSNPVTNITGGALGVFSVYTSQYKEVIVP